MFKINSLADILRNSADSNQISLIFDHFGLKSDYVSYFELKLNLIDVNTILIFISL